MRSHSHRISRRRLFGTGAAAGAGALAARGAAAEAAGGRASTTRRRTADVVVIGGGFAGLSAAWEVVRAGRSVLVLEAQDHVGGRARNLEIAGGEISERGATFAGPTQNEILALAKEMGVETFPTFAYGRPAAERREAALGSFANYSGPKAREATQYFESTWPGNRWHRGGPVGIAGPAHGHALKEPVGSIHWAGTETSSYWAGYMDGAVRSGRRAAVEVLGAL